MGKTVIEYEAKNYDINGYGDPVPAVTISTTDRNLLNSIIAYLHGRIADEVMDEEWDAVSSTAKQILDIHEAYENLFYPKQEEEENGK